jgi:hypothetical protein
MSFFQVLPVLTVNRSQLNPDPYNTLVHSTRWLHCLNLCFGPFSSWRSLRDFGADWAKMSEPANTMYISQVYHLLLKHLSQGLHCTMFTQQTTAMIKQFYMYWFPYVGKSFSIVLFVHLYLYHRMSAQVQDVSGACGSLNQLLFMACWGIGLAYALAGPPCQSLGLRLGTLLAI